MKSGYAILFGLSGVSAIALPMQAQVTIDGTTNTILDSNRNGIIINGGDRAGNNLFHSFQDFSVINGNEAFFNNAVDIRNIFSRVTGGNISNIDGLLRTNGSANLFIINPAGIIFGEGASLNIGGSFFATTADSIVFADDIEFSAIDSENPPLLTINQPIGLVLGNNPGAIVNQSTADDVGLQVSPGNNLTLVGGNIEFNGGTIFAPGANIELGGLSAAGEIGIDADGSLNFPEDVVKSDVTLTNGTEINVQAAGGGNITINANNIELSSGELGQSVLSAGITSDSGSPNARAGDITLNATGDIDITDSRIRNILEESRQGNSGNINLQGNNLFFTRGGSVAASTSGLGNAGTIVIKAFDSIIVDGEDTTGFPSAIASQVLSSAVGNGGEINITATNFSLLGGTFLSTGSFGDGNAGTIKINASETITLDGESSFGFGSGIFSTIATGNRLQDDPNFVDPVTGEGNPGRIEIETTNLFLKQGGIIATDTLGIGNSGDIVIKASDSIVISGEDSAGFVSIISSSVLESAEGNSGTIKITTTNLSLTEGGQIGATTFGDGNAGTIAIEAFDTITLEGKSPSGFPAGIFSNVDLGTGDSGGIEINTQNLSIKKGSEISATTFGNGNAGTITIDASNSIFIDGEDAIRDVDRPGITSKVDDEGVGNAGGINIITGNLLITNKGKIDVQSTGKGTAGSLFIQANSLSLDNNSLLLASTPVGEGGEIRLEISNSVILHDNSSIIARAFESADGGNVIIDAGSIVAFPNQNNDIIAAAEKGRGGEINITTSAIFGIAERSSIPENITNDLDASSEFGIDGTIAINELDVNPAEGLEELPTEAIDVASLVAQNLCQQGQGSEFIVTGKGGLASSPSQTRNSNLSQVDLVEPVLTSPPTLPIQEKGAVDRLDNNVKEIVEIRGWVVNSRGTIELVANSTNATGSLPQPVYDRICLK